jgi:hypothetical protein
MFRKKDEVLTMFLIQLIILFAFVNTFLMGKSHDILRFVLFMLFPIMFISLGYLQSLKKITGYIGLAVVVGALVFLQFGKFASYLSSSFSNTFYSSNEYAVSEWIRVNTNQSDVILTSPLATYTAVSERRIILAEPFYASGQLYDPTERVVDLSRLYVAPSQDLLSKYNISYIVVGSREVDFFGVFNLYLFDFGNSSAFTPVYSTTNYTVYKVTNRELLPKVSSIGADSMRTEMLDTYPARWLAF